MSSGSGGEGYSKQKGLADDVSDEGWQDESGTMQ